MADLVRASGQSRLVIILDKRYYDLEPGPLHSLTYYMRLVILICMSFRILTIIHSKGIFEQSVLLEPVQDLGFLCPPHALRALAAFSTSPPANEAAMSELEKDWIGTFPTRMGFSQLYDLTVVNRDALPQAFRGAQPDSRPFGRELNLKNCRCLSTGQWVNGRYEIGTRFAATCSSCGFQLSIVVPMGTKLCGRNKRWYVKIEQFYT